MTKALLELEDKGVGIFMSKPQWKERYDNAPEGAKSYYRLMFAMTLLGTVAKDGRVDMASIGADEERDRIYHTMDDESWDYVLSNAGHAEALGLYIARSEMQGEAGGEVRLMAFVTANE